MSNEPTIRRVSSISVHLPLGLLGAAIALHIFSQAMSVSGQREVLRTQIENTEKQRGDLQAAEEKYKVAFTQREPSVKQSVELQGKFQALLGDLLELSKTDADAKKVVDAWNIKMPSQAPATGAEAATPAAAAAMPEKRP